MSPAGTKFVVTTTHVLLISIVALGLTLTPPTGSTAGSSRLTERSSEVGVASDSQRHTLGTVIWTETLANIGAWECAQNNAADLALHLRDGNVRIARFPSVDACRQAIAYLKQACEAHSVLR